MRFAITLAALAAACLLAAPAQAEERPQVAALLTNSLADPLGIGGEPPRLSWQLRSDRRGVVQTAYRVRVSSPQLGDVWDSGKVESRRSVDVPYGGPALRSHTRYTWSVRVWDDAAPAPRTGARRPRSRPACSTPPSGSGEWIGAPGARRRVDRLHGRVHRLRHHRRARRLPPRPRQRERLHVADQRERRRAAPAREDERRLLRPPRRRRSRPASTSPPRTATRSRVSGDTISDARRRRAARHAHRSAPTTAPGIMGFRTDGAERGLVHDVTVTSAGGERARRHRLPGRRPHASRPARSPATGCSSTAPAARPG